MLKKNFLGVPPILAPRRAGPPKMSFHIFGDVCKKNMAPIGQFLEHSLATASRANRNRQKGVVISVLKEPPSGGVCYRRTGPRIESG